MKIENRVGVRPGRAGMGRAMSVAWALVPVLLGLLNLGSGGCQYLSGRSDTVGSALYKSEPDIRVRVRKGADTARVEGPAHVIVRTTLGSTPPATMATPLTATASTRGIKIVDANGTTQELGFGNSVELIAAPGAPDGEHADNAPLPAEFPFPLLEPGKKPATTPGVAADALKLDGAPLPGLVTFRPRTDEGDRFDIIATMPMETYLPGVLDGELYATWSLGTFEMQAVAARTYALHEREVARRQGAAFDVESTTADQVFRGLVKNPVASDAAKRTRGEILTYRGKLIKAYYSSTCGGRPGSASDVWPTGEGFEANSVAPLQAKERTIYCQASPYYRWEITRGDDDVSARIRAWGSSNGNEIKRMGRIRKAEVVRANRLGRPAEFKITDDRGNTYRIGAEQLRSACNFPVSSLPAVTRETRVPSGDLVATTWADQVKFTGQGFGHGVGMCQWCAKGMGERGIPYQKALEDFYPGAKVTKGY